MKKERVLIVIPESQWEKMEKLRRGEIITFGRFKLVTRGSKGEDKTGGGHGEGSGGRGTA